MNKRKILIAALALCVVAILAIGTTLAYFVDNDHATNTFTVGNISIDLIESQYHRVNAGKGYTEEKEPIIGGYLWASKVPLEGTPENSPTVDKSGWTGTYFSDAQILNDAKETFKDYFAKEAAYMVPGDNVRKNPYVRNTSKYNAAYVRVKVLIPASLFKVLDMGPSYWTTEAMKTGSVLSAAVAAYNEAGSIENFMALTGEDGTHPYDLTVGKETYYVFDFTYTDELEPGEMTFWNCWGNIAIDKDADNDDLNNVSNFDVLIYADGIQAEGFEDATAAFNAFDAQVGAENWFVDGNWTNNDKAVAEFEVEDDTYTGAEYKDPAI